MGFFDKIFGKSTDQMLRIRAQFKDVEFFKALLLKKDNTIKSYHETNAALQKKGTFKPFNNWVIAMEHLDKIYVYYSMGEDIHKCYDEYIDAAQYYAEAWDPDSFYADMIDMVALGYLLDVPAEVYQPVIAYVAQADKASSYAQWHPDALLWYIISAKTSTIHSVDKVIHPRQHQDLWDLTKMPKPKAEKAMKVYLDKWYDRHKEYPWYDVHKKPNNYRGYWSWEGGAVAKIMGLDDTGFKDSPYYPYELVHWKDN